MALFLLVSLGFVAIALFLPEDPTDTDRWRILSGGFFGLCAAAFSWTLVRPMRLRLDATGYTLSGGFVFSPKTVPWREVEEFFVYTVPRGGKQVGLNFRPEVRERTWALDLNRRAGADGMLPGPWAIPAEELVAELNRYRLEAGDRP